MTAEAKGPNGVRVAHMVTRLRDQEEHLGGWLKWQRSTVAAPPHAVQAIDRGAALARAHVEALTSHLALHGSNAGAGQNTGQKRLQSPVSQVGAMLGDGLDATAVLWELHTAHQQLAMGYGLLWTAALRANDYYSDRPIMRLAERFQRDYAGTAHQIAGALHDVLAWELLQAGEPCACACRTCRDLGFCRCTSAGRSLMMRAWADTAVPEEAGFVARHVLPGMPAHEAGLRDGDVITGIGTPGQEMENVPDVWRFGAQLNDLPAGQPVRLQVRRADGKTDEVVVATRELIDAVVR